MSMITIVKSRSAPITGHLALMERGLIRCGERPIVQTRGQPVRTSVVICWSWHIGRGFARAGHRVLVMERGYIPDRMAWTSLAWDGLNGKGRFLIPDDGGARWRKHFDGLLQDRHNGNLATVMGQKPGDASLHTFPGVEWYTKAAAISPYPTEFRHHPMHDLRPKWRTGLPEAQGELPEVLARSGLVIAWNSNSLVDAVLAGCTIRAGDPGGMAWSVADYQGLSLDRRAVNREAWAHRMAWTQWSEEEIADGTAWAHAREALDAPVFNKS